MSLSRFYVTVCENGMMLHCFETNAIRVDQTKDEITIRMPNGLSAKREDIIATLAAHFAEMREEDRKKLPDDIRKMLGELLHIEQEKTALRGV